MLFWLINKTSKIPRRIIGVPHEWYCCATLVRKDKLKNSTKCGKLVDTFMFPVRESPKVDNPQVPVARGATYLFERKRGQPKVLRLK